MALKIRLRRMGRKNAPTYRIVVAEASMPRDGRLVDSIGHYNPRTEPLTLVVDRAKALQWIERGAVPTETTRALLKRAGIFRPEEPGAVGAVIETVTDAARGAAGKAAAAVKGAVSKAAEAVADAAEDVVEKVQGEEAAGSVTTEEAETAAEETTGAAEETTGAAEETVSDAEASGVAGETVATDGEAASAEEGPVGDEKPQP